MANKAGQEGRWWWWWWRVWGEVNTPSLPHSLCSRGKQPQMLTGWWHRDPHPITPRETQHSSSGVYGLRCPTNLTHTHTGKSVHVQHSTFITLTEETNGEHLSFLLGDALLPDHVTLLIYFFYKTERSKRQYMQLSNYHTTERRASRRVYARQALLRRTDLSLGRVHRETCFLQPSTFQQRNPPTPPDGVSGPSSAPPTPAPHHIHPLLHATIYVNIIYIIIN